MGLVLELPGVNGAMMETAQDAILRRETLKVKLFLWPGVLRGLLCVQPVANLEVFLSSQCM